VPWRKHPLFEPSFADGETRTGDGQLRSLQFSPLSSKSKSITWDSRTKPVPLRPSYETGASAIEIGATSRNGCSPRGKSLCVRALAAKRRCSEDNNSRGHGRSINRLSIHRLATAVASPRYALAGVPMTHGERRIRTVAVDDSADYLRYLCAFLESLSKVDLIAKGGSGRDAVRLAHEWMPDLVLMDSRMPEMTGLEAASQLTRELPDVIVILTSAFEAEGIWRASQQSGAFAFVMKEHLTHDLPRLLELAETEKGWDKPRKSA
jgi:CheY-like chemotaxis protein